MPQKPLAKIIKDNFNTVFYLIVVVLIFFLLILLVGSYKYFYLPQQQHLSNNIRYFMNTANKELSEVEATYNQILEDKLKEFYAGYEGYREEEYIEFHMEELKSSLEEVEIENIEVKQINYYFLSPEGKVFKTDYENDLGLDLSNYEIWQQISALETGEVMLDSIQSEVRNDNFRSFAYVRLPDGNIFEVGLAFNDSYLENLRSRLRRLAGNQVERLTLFDYNLKPFLGAEDTLSEEEKGFFQKSLTENKVVVRTSSLFSQSFYYGGETNYQSPRYIKLKVNYPYLKHIFFVFCVIVGFVVFGFIILSRKLKKSLWSKVAAPLTKIADRISSFSLTKEIRGEMPVSEVSEIEEIKDNYLEMAEEATASYQQLEAYSDEITNLNEKLKYQALHDPLTGLPNRRKFIDKLKTELEVGNQGAVILLDLNNFKEINDAVGHVYGDKLLKAVGQKLLNLPEDKVFVARYGGDEFLLLLPGESQKQVINQWVEKINNLFSQSFMVGNDELDINFSMGIARYPDDASSTYQLITSADIAMYKAKEMTRNNYLYYNSQMSKRLREKKEIKEILKEALVQDGFKLKYQPQINLETGKISHLEALIRLKNKNLSPGKFIPVAEESNLIIELGRWVTKAVINQLAKWKEKGINPKAVSINFSAKQLRDNDYIEFLRKELKEKGVSPNLIEIEITERVLLKETKQSLNFLADLKDLGVKIALDDFGTGYSSLNYLTYIQLDRVKLDKSLNDKFLQHSHLETMENLIDLLHSMNLPITAEGIEVKEQYQKLKAMECDYIQGYLFSRPVPPEEIEEIYNDNFIQKI